MRHVRGPCPKRLANSSPGVLTWSEWPWPDTEIRFYTLVACPEHSNGARSSAPETNSRRVSCPRAGLRARLWFSADVLMAPRTLCLFATHFTCCMVFHDWFRFCLHLPIPLCKHCRIKTSGKRRRGELASSWIPHILCVYPLNLGGSHARSRLRTS